MSVKRIKSNLGKRNDCVLSSQPLGVSYIDCALKNTLIAEISEGETFKNSREGLFNSSPNYTKENMNCNGASTSVESFAYKRKKGRRSMLGQRTKVNFLNNTKNFPIEENSFELGKPNEELSSQNNSNYNLIVKTPQGKFLNPLHSLSPLFTNGKIIKSANQPEKSTAESKSPLNPFGYDEGASQFFENEINEIGSWSVFKTKQAGIKSPSLEKNTERFPKHEVSTASNELIRKNFKTKLFQTASQDSCQSSRRIEKNLAGLNISKCNKNLGIHSKHDQEIHYGANQSDDNNAMSRNENADTESTCSEVVSKDDFDSSDEDLLTANNCTVLAAAEKTKKKTPKLSTICELDLIDDLHSTSTLKPDEFSSDSNGNLSHNEDDQLEKYLDKISELQSICKKHSDNMEELIKKIVQEKEMYNSNYNLLDNAIKQYRTKYNERFKVNKTEDCTNCKQIYKHMIKFNMGSKIMGSPVASPSFKNRKIISPLNISKTNKLKNTKRYCELRKSFSYLTTPDRKNDKKKLVNSSLCYTPKSLSRCLSEQMDRLNS